MQVVRLEGLLNALHPEVELVQLILEQVREANLGVEEAAHNGDQHSVVAEADEFEDECHDVLPTVTTGIVTVAHCGERLEDPVKRKDICGVLGREWHLIISHSIKIVDIEPGCAFFGRQILV